MRLSRLFAAVSLFVPTLVSAQTEGQTEAEVLVQAVEAVCPQPDLTGLDAQTALPGTWLLEETRFPAEGEARQVTVSLVRSGGDELLLERRQINGQLRQFRASFLRNTPSGVAPALLAIADGSCTIQSGRALRSDGEVWRFLDQLDGDLATLRWSETLQAPWPEGVDRGGVRVGLVDSGLAYDLPIFKDRLARGPDGTPLGYDYWDLDPWPYDGDVARGPFLPIRHGTAVASILAREAPDADLVPYRYPRPDMTRLGDLVTRAAADGVRILAMPLGSNRRADWEAFGTALDQHDMLAIVSAGNNGRDIDAVPVYPAALASKRLLTVTSSDAFGRLAPGSNWGATTVDIMLPAENLEVVDFRGARGTASGSSYAVPRLAALAARLLAQDPSLAADELKAEILRRTQPSPFERDDVLAVGWLPNPLDE